MSTAYLARWSGPINESDDPYNPNPPYTSPSGLPVQKHVQEVLIIPDRGNSLDNENIKQAIMSYGGVFTTYYSSSSYATAPCYSSTCTTYYYNGSNSADHAVVIVGWDDNFPASSFSPAAPDNGAFIIKNSWGTSWGVNGGYFYISYYDTLIGKNNYVFNGAEPTTNYSSIYEYDPLGWTTSLGYGNDAAWFSNIFTAVANEQVAAVSFYTASLNSSYTVYIFTNVGSNPIGGTLSGSQTGTITWPGYHTISLGTPVSISSSQNFSIAVSLTTPGYNYPIPIELPITGYSSAATASAGQSYVSSDGTNWQDITTLYTNTNVCLKAFTTQNAIQLDHIVISPSSATINAGASQAYTATGYDASNNVVGIVTSSTTFSISPDGSCTGATCSATVAGPHTVIGNDSGKTATASLQVPFPSGTIIINGGAAASKGTTVTLTLTADSASQMCVSNTTSCTAWRALAATTSWTLTPGDGTKTVYVWFRDVWGNTTATPYSASIILDTTAPTNGTVTATP
ncbi:MAG TPA: hypothetical protein DCP92_10345, partial [Nitrospiraceae bacterium]|nr:hypothetical protein [Nitrospiraceae bacterium]